MGGYVRKWDGWKGRSFLYCAALTAKARAHVLDSLITNRKGRGVMHIGRANDKLKSGNAACPACLPCMLWGKQVHDVCRERTPLRFSPGFTFDPPGIPNKLLSVLKPT